MLDAKSFRAFAGHDHHRRPVRYHGGGRGTGGSIDRLVREFRVGAETGEDRVRLVRLCAEAGVAVRDALSRTGPADFDEPEPQPQPARVSEEEPVISIEGPFGLSPQRVRLQSREAAYHRRPR